MRNLNNLSPFLIQIGLVLVVLGLLIRFLPQPGMFGDIIIERKNFNFYFPLGSCIILSLFLSLFFLLFRR